MRNKIAINRPGARGGVASLFAALLLLAGCDVKDPIYNTAHPDKGQITLTTDWSARTAGVDIPASYTVAVGDTPATLSGVTNTLGNLFNPNTYHIRIYNTPQHISVSGATITVAQTTAPVMLNEVKYLMPRNTGQEILRGAQNDRGNAQNDRGNAQNDNGVGQFVQGEPGWLFTSTLDAAIEADTDHELTAAMQQQVRQLTLFIEPTGGGTDKIERIEGYLTGVASTLDMDNGTHGTPLNVALTFAKVADGANAGKWAATVRLLGVAGAGQKLHAKLYFEGNTPKPVTLIDADGIEGCDLTAELADFNNDKTKPLALGGSIVETPTSAGLTATITAWKTVKDDGPVYAE